MPQLSEIELKKQISCIKVKQIKSFTIGITMLSQVL